METGADVQQGGDTAHHTESRNKLGQKNTHIWASVLYSLRLRCGEENSGIDISDSLVPLDSTVFKKKHKTGV